jgi:F0F1-type ATP synthase epsilon subunit
MKSNNELHVRVSKATKLVWEGQATAVSSKNASGPFDILPMHANFISLVTNTPIKVLAKDGTTKDLKAKQAVVFVENNDVKIYLNI